VRFRCDHQCVTTSFSERKIRNAAVGFQRQSIARRNQRSGSLSAVYHEPTQRQSIARRINAAAVYRQSIMSQRSGSLSHDESTQRQSPSCLRRPSVLHRTFLSHSSDLVHDRRSTSARPGGSARARLVCTYVPHIRTSYVRSFPIPPISSTTDAAPARVPAAARAPPAHTYIPLCILCKNKECTYETKRMKHLRTFLSHSSDPAIHRT
jgi:hypothetical protein